MHTKVGVHECAQFLIFMNCLKPLFGGAQRWNRTTDTRIFSPLLYQLSYLGLGKEIILEESSLMRNQFKI